MHISLSWLKEFIDIKEDQETISDVLTQTGLEVEGVEVKDKIPGGLRGLVVGEVITCASHPNADKLKVTTVDIGNGEPVPIVCGAPNVDKGQKVIVAPVNTTIYPTEGEPFKIKKAKIRGEASQGMICAEDEVGLGSSHDGIMILDTQAPNGTPAAELFENNSDVVFEIGLTPNRGDAASHLGTARDLRAYYKREIRLPEPGDFDIKEDNPIGVEVENTEACPRYCGVTIRGVKVGPSPDWLQWRLRAIGLEPINNIVDITNYILHGLGQPLHAFDAAVVGKKVIVKTLPAESKFTTLDEKERKLASNDLMICNESGGMCIAGVFGGIESGVKETTTDIFLESAYFSPDFVRATAMRHGLSTDASFRFERGVDPEITLYALKIATRLILELAGGNIASDFVDVYPKPIQPVRIDTKKSTFDRLIGKELALEQIFEILELLDIKCGNKSGDKFTAIVPPYRSEVTREADLVEEVLRIYGINNIEIDESFSTDYLAEFDEIEPYKLQEDLSHYLAGQGFREILTNSLTNNQYQEKLKLSKLDSIHVLNPSSEELSTLKTSTLYTALESVRYNLNRRQTNIRFFEFAKTYGKSGETRIEEEKLCLYLSGKSWEASWLAEPYEASIHVLSAKVEDLLERTGLSEIRKAPMEDSPVFAYGIEYKAGKRAIGSVGKLQSSILDHYDIEQDIYYAELDWEYIKQHASKERYYTPIPKFPEVRRDLSLVLDKSISYSEIERIAFQSEKKLLNRINLFSVYEGEQIGEGKKAYAATFYLQDPEKTLTDKHIEKTMNRLIQQFETQLNALIRK
jgi:phenylalanyl-tRNA synthetase beta chain